MLLFLSAWDPSFLESIDSRLTAVEKSLDYYADSLLYDAPQLESVAGGLKNITNISTYMPCVCTCMCMCHYMSLLS